MKVGTLCRRVCSSALLGSIFLFSLESLNSKPAEYRLGNPVAEHLTSLSSRWQHDKTDTKRFAKVRNNSDFDPVLVYSTYLGGPSGAGVANANPQRANVVFVDATGNLYVAGETNSTNFPVTAGVVEPNNAAANPLGFVAKVDPSGQTLLFSTYIDGITDILAMTVDGTGHIYVAGPTGSGVGTPLLPIPPGATPFQAAPKGNNIGIVKLNSTATVVISATYLGGSATDQIAGLAVDSSGNLYIAGSTNSNDFPTHNPLQGSLGSVSNVFVTVLNSSLSAAVYSTYLGQASVANTGPGPHSIAVDGSKNAYVVGTATAGFPTTAGAVQTSCAFASNPGCAFVAKLNPSGLALVYSTYFGNAEGQGNAVAVDSSSNIYISGQVRSTGFTEVNPVAGFPSCSVPFTAGGFVSEINAAGALTFSTCVQASLYTLVLDSAANVYVAGEFAPGIPLKNPIQANSSQGSSFIFSINPHTSTLLFSSFIGGAQQNLNVSETETLNDIGVDANSNIYTAGYTPNASPPVFPLFNPLQAIPGATTQCPSLPCITTSNAILLKVSPTDAPAAAVSPSSVTFGPQQVGSPSAAQPVTIIDMGSTPLVVSNVTVTGDFAIQSGCTTVAPAGATCAIAVAFTPTAAGTRTGTLTITDNSAGSLRTVQLTGQGGTAVVMLTPTSLTFPGQAPSTTSGSQQITLTNTGAIDLQISRIDTSGPFAENNSCGLTLAAGQFCFINVTFSPTAAGAATGTLTLTDSAADSPQTVALIGTESAPSLGFGIHTSSVGTMSTTAGGTVIYTLAIGGAGLGGTATLTCAGAPKGASCTVSPSPLQFSASTVSAVSATVTTTARSTLIYYPEGPASWIWTLAIIGAGILLRTARHNPALRLRWRLVPVLAIAMCACGGGSSNNSSGTPTGSYTLVVTATSGGTTQTVNLTLVVQ